MRGISGARGLLLALLVLACATVLALAIGVRHSRTSSSAAAMTLSLPAPTQGFRVPSARAITGGVTGTWAPVLRPVIARRRPAASSPAVGRVSTITPEGTANLVEPDSEVRRSGALWVRTRLAQLPNGTEGWIPRAALGGWSFVSTRVVVDRVHLTLSLYRGARRIFRAPVGVGAAATPTPAGRFYVRDRLTKYASPEYGPVAFGTTARSPFLTDWPAGGFIGIHGTDRPGLIPGRVSHGCIRLRNPAIRALARLMPVGTPVIIR